MKRWLDAALAVAVVILVWLLYRKVTRLWWTYDDAYTLHVVVDHTVRDFFTSGSVWPQRLYAPLEKVAYELQLAWFGLHPARWYVVHLCVASAAALAVYAAARCYFRPAAAFVVAALFVAAVPLCSQTTELGSTHYFQAIALAGLATVLYVRALRTGRIWLAIISAGLYFTAMLAKETVVPLAALVVVLPDRDWRTRARFAMPHGVVLLVYLAMRRAVIGTIFGGYGWAVREGEWPALIASLPKKLFLAMAGANLTAGTILLVVVAIGAVIALRDRRAVLLFAVALVLAVGPIVPMSKDLHRRFALMPWLCLSFAFVAGAESLRQNARRARAGAALLLAAPILMIVTNRQEWAYEFGRTLRMSDEARVFWDLPPQALLRAPLVPPAAMAELNWLKTVYAGLPGGAGWFYDDLYLCMNDVRGKRAWQYEAMTRTVAEITPALPGIARRACSTIRHQASLRAEFHYRDETLFWNFGPYSDGRYRVLFANGVQAFDVPREGGFRLAVPGLELRVRYQSPAGWVTYSPEIALDFNHHPDFRWQR